MTFTRRAESITYQTRKEILLSDLDIGATQRFAMREDIIDKLVSMIAPRVIGYNHIKEGLLLCAIAAARDIPSDRRRINAIIVGEKGLAKSQLMRESVNLVPDIRYEIRSQSSSAKSLTAIVSKEEERYVLRLGPIPMAKEAICFLNEFESNTEIE